ncbi:MAG: hypothetical protein ACI91B_000537 [Planctomycetota bacterium]|jgi:hypothetical protein
MTRSRQRTTPLVLTALLGSACSGGSDNLESSAGPVNSAPTVDAGPDSAVYRGALGQLDGSATDDGLPSPLTYLWEHVGGPGNAVIQDPDALGARVSFDTNGTHVLRLTANDGLLSRSDEHSVTVTDPPEVIVQYGGAVLDDVSGITPVITISRTTGEIPCVVQATAAASSATWINPDTSASEPLPNPYDQLHYTWNFGEGLGTQAITNPVTGLMMDADVHQTGPQATFIYRTPGTYTITLTASIKNLTGAVTEVNTQVVVTVSDFGGQTQYFDPVAGDDANNGLAASTPKRSWNAYSSWATGGDNRRALLKRGTTMVQTGDFRNEHSHTRVEPYGTGADPIIQVEAAPSFSGYMVSVWAADFLEDQLYRGIRFMGMGEALNIVHAYGVADPSSQDVVFMDCTFENHLPLGDDLMVITGNHHSRFTSWNCHFRHNDSGDQGMYVSLAGSTAPAEFLSVVGGSFTGGDGNSILDHHIYATGWRRYDLMRWIDFGQAINKNFCLNMNATSSNHNTDYILIDGCNVTGTNNGIDASNGSNNPSLGQFDHFIIQNTAIHDVGTTQGHGVMGYCIRRYVIRDSFFYGNRTRDMSILDPGVDYQVYRNIFWRDSTGNTNLSVRVVAGQHGTFTDNIFEVASNPGLSQRIIDFQSTEVANYSFRGNQYWCPELFAGGQVSPFLDLDTMQRLSMGQWLALFPDDGPYANPGFSDPANGVF